MRPHSISKPGRSEFQKMRQRLTVPVFSGRPERRKISKTINPSESEENNIVILCPENHHDDAEQESVPNLESEVEKGGQGCLEKIANNIRGAVLMRTLKWAPICLAPVAITSVNCAHTQGSAGKIEIPKSVNLKEALKAVKDKEYVIAWSYFKDKNYPEDSEYAKYYQEAKKGAEGMANYYLINARKQVNRKRPIQYRDYHQAIRDWKNAITIRGKNHPNNKIVEKEIRWAEDELASFEEEYKDQFNKLKELLKEPNYEKEVWMDIIRTFERLRILRLALKKEDKSLTPLAIGYFDKFLKEKKYKYAKESARMAKALDIKETSFGKGRQLSDKDESRFAAAHHLYEENEKKANELLQKMETALKEKRKKDVKKISEEILKLDPDKSTTKRVKKLLAKINVKHKKRHRRKRTTASVKSPDANEIVYLTKEKPLSGGSGLGRIEKILEKLNQEFENGNEFGAIVKLEKSIKEAKGNKHQNRLLKLRKLWNPTKKRLIRETLKKANRAFLIKDHQTAKQYYKAVLDLDPGNATASKRFKFLSRLKLKASNGEPSEE